jgi:pimeloyl-ACP methyl ester carboxylesterase
MADLLQRYGGSDPDSAHARAKILAAVDPGVLAQVMDGSIRDEWTTDPQLRRIECPVLLLQADPSAGAALAEADARRAQSQLRQYTFRRFEGVGHSIHRDAMGAFMEALDAFLDDVEGVPATT